MDLQGAALLITVALIIVCHLLSKLKQRLEATELSWGAIAKSSLLFEVHEDQLIDPFYLPLAPWGGISALRQGLLESVMLRGGHGSRIPPPPPPAAAIGPAAAPVLLADVDAAEGQTSIAAPPPLALQPAPIPTPSSRIPTAPRPTASVSSSGTPIPAPAPLANMSAGRRRQQQQQQQRQQQQQPASTPGLRASFDGSQLPLPPVCPNSPSRLPTASRKAGMSSSSSSTIGRPPRSPAAAPVKPTPWKAAPPHHPTTPLQQPWSPRTAAAPLAVSQQPWSPRKAPLSPTMPQQLLSPRKVAVPRSPQSSPRVVTPQLLSPRKAASPSPQQSPRSPAPQLLSPRKAAPPSPPVPQCLRLVQLTPSPQQSPRSPAPQLLSPRRAPLQTPLPLRQSPRRGEPKGVSHAQVQVHAAIVAAGKPLQQQEGQPSQHAVERQLPPPPPGQQLVREEEEQEKEKELQQVLQATEEQQQKEEQQQQGGQLQQEQSHEQKEQQAPRVQQEDVPHPSQQQQQQQRSDMQEQQQQQQPGEEGEGNEQKQQEVQGNQSLTAPVADPAVGGSVSSAAVEAKEVPATPRDAAAEGPELLMTPRHADNDTPPASASRTPAPFNGAARPRRSGTAGDGSSPTSVLMQAVLSEGRCLPASGGGARHGGELSPVTPLPLPPRSASSQSALCATASFSSLASSDLAAATPLSTASSLVLSCELSCGGGRGSSSTCDGDDLGGAGSTIYTLSAGAAGAGKAPSRSSESHANACYGGSDVASTGGNGIGGSCSSGGGSRYGNVSLVRTSSRWFSSVGGGSGGSGRAGGLIGNAGAAGISFLALARVTQMDAAAAASSPPLSPFKYGGVAAVSVPKPAVPALAGRRLGKPNTPRISGL